MTALAAEAPLPALSLVEHQKFAERRLCEDSFVDFLGSLTLPDRHRGTIAYEMWPHLVKLAKDFAAHLSVLVLKARQLGVSWLLAAYALWVAMYKANSLVLEISISKEDANDLLDKSYQLYLLMPQYLRVPLRRYRASRLSFEGGGSIRSLPQTKTAGRGQTASVVIVDEAAFHTYAATNYTAYEPALDGGGQLIMVSTSNGPMGLFYDMYEGREAIIEYADDLVRHFIPWYARPLRYEVDEHGIIRPNWEWLGRARARFRGLPVEFTREYPETPEEAWQAASGLVYGIDPQTGELIFSAKQHRPDAPSQGGNLAHDPVPLERCWRRFFGIDWGGGDPTAVGIYGQVEPFGRVHKYAEFHKVGPTTLEEIAGFLQSWTPEEYWESPHSYWESGEAGADEPNAIATLRGWGWPVRTALTKRKEGRGAVSFFLRQRRLTFHPDRCPETLREFRRYRWATRRDVEMGERFTLTEPYDRDDHHMDEMRYVCLRIDKEERMLEGNSGFGDVAFELSA